jgi:hypothetical protein
MFEFQALIGRAQRRQKSIGILESADYTPYALGSWDTGQNIHVMPCFATKTIWFPRVNSTTISKALAPASMHREAAATYLQHALD